MDNDDIALWKHYTKDIKPLKNKKPTVKSIICQSQNDDKGDKTLKEDRVKNLKSKNSDALRENFNRKNLHDVSGQTQNTIVQSRWLRSKIASSEPLTMSFTELKKIKSGKVFMTKIDLHGMNREQAFEELYHFFSCMMSQKQKFVLVITGKGDKGKTSCDPQGVLRQSFKRWVQASSLSNCIVSIHEAYQKHGGTGAFYVKLRTKSHYKNV